MDRTLEVSTGSVRLDSYESFGEPVLHIDTWSGSVPGATLTVDDVAALVTHLEDFLAFHTGKR
jgi:hypothetical protein